MRIHLLATGMMMAAVLAGFVIGTLPLPLAAAAALSVVCGSLIGCIWVWLGMRLGR